MGPRRRGPEGHCKGGSAVTGRDGWLVEQLPRVMGEDPVLHDLVSAFEQVHDTVRERIDAIEYQVDTGLASPEMLAHLGSWLGVMLEPTDPAEYRRSLVREVGKLLGWRGTRYGVEARPQAAHGARGGGTGAGGERLPRPGPGAGGPVSTPGGLPASSAPVPPPGSVGVVQMDTPGTSP